MLKEGKVTIEEAEKLLAALGEQEVREERPGTSPKYLRVVIADGGEQKVNVRVPMKLIRAGMKLSAFIPEQARGEIEKRLGEKGMDVNLKKLKPEDLEDLIASLGELNVEIEDGGEKKVRIFCE